MNELDDPTIELAASGQLDALKIPFADNPDLTTLRRSNAYRTVRHDNPQIKEAQQ